MGEKKRREAGGRPPPLPFETLEEAWNLAARMMLPPDLPAEGRELLRRVFFMGAGAIWDVQMHWLEEGVEPTEADMRRMDRLHGELEAFRLAQQAAGMASRPAGTGH
jgi:hypothetical protein